MACSNIQLNGMSVGCKDNIGGIRKAYICKNDDITSFSLSTANTVSAITMVSGKTFATYEFRKNTSDYQCTITSDDAIGTFSIDSNINLQFSNITSIKNEEIEALGKEDLTVIVLDNMGKLWLFGGKSNGTKEELPVTCSAGTLNSGKATTDGGIYNITLSTSANHFPYEVTTTVPVA